LDKAGSGKGLVVVSTEDGSPVFEMPLNHTDYTKFSMQSSGVDGREARWTFASGVPGSMDRDLFATLWSGDRDVKVDLLTKIVGDARKHDPMDPAFAQSLEPSPLST
jgi:hypothetical protein